MAKSAWMIVPNLLRTLVRSDVALKSKLLLFAGLIYLISPVDLLPDVLVGIGWLDDLLIVPLLGWLSYRSLPSSVQEDVVQNEATAGKQSRRIYLYLGILVIAVIGIVMLGGTDGNVIPENAPLSN
ncbi:DUF1232 domain-containing protein [Thalassospira sp.]|uniref:YkvA family protein n=1 Tax=Thalassospira sp. TaxID=1912094 RepID=UPI0032EAF7A9